MKTKLPLFVVLLILIMAPVCAQQKTKKELKEEQILEKQKQTEAIVNSQQFVFVARFALPQGFSQVDLTSNPNYLKFRPDMIDCYMPFFGKAYSVVGLDGDTGFKFKGKPEKFTIEKTRKNFRIDANVKADSDNFRLSFSVSFDGITTLSIISNNRSTISYQGEISPIQ